MKKLFLGIIFILGMFIVNSDKVMAIDSTQFLPDSSQNSILYDGTSFGSPSISSWGTSGFGNSLIGFIYTPKKSHYVCQVDFHIRKVGNPLDTFALFVRSNAEDNLLDGDPLTESSNNWQGTDFVTVDTYVTSFWFGTPLPPSNCFGVVKDISYSFYLERTGSLNFSDYYQSTTNITSDPNGEINSASTVGVSSNAAWVQIYGIENGSGLDNQVSDTSSFCEGLGIFTTACQTAVFLFIPNTNVLQSDITDLKDLLGTKVPFAYAISALELDFSSTNSSTSTPTISLPINVEVAGATTLNTSFDWNDTQGEGIVSNTAGMIRGIFVILLWLVFIFYLFVLVRHIF